MADEKNLLFKYKYYNLVQIMIKGIYINRALIICYTRKKIKRNALLA